MTSNRLAMMENPVRLLLESSRGGTVQLTVLAESARLPDLARRPRLRAFLSPLP
jgi:hypothetical protein